MAGMRGASRFFTTAAAVTNQQCTGAGRPAPTWARMTHRVANGCAEKCLSDQAAAVSSSFADSDPPPPPPPPSPVSSST
eukprot:9485081-Pyramimonas_sp.AAC.2